MRSVKLTRMMAILMIFIIISSGSFAAVQCYTIEGAVQSMIQEGSDQFDTIDSLAQARGVSKEHIAYIVLLASRRGDIVEDLRSLQNENFGILDIDNYLQQIDKALEDFDLDKTKELLAESVQMSHAISADTLPQARDVARARIGKEPVTTEKPAEEASAESEEQRLERIKLGVEKVQELEALGERIEDETDAFTFEQAVAELRANEDLIIDALESEDFATKILAMEMLGRIGSEKSVSALQDLADSEDYGVASTAKDILSQIAEAEPAPTEPGRFRRFIERNVNRFSYILNPLSVIAASTLITSIALSGTEYFQQSYLWIGAVPGTILAVKTSLKPISWLYHLFKSPPEAKNIDGFFIKNFRKTDAVSIAISERHPVKAEYVPVVVKEGETPVAEEDRIIKVEGRKPIPVLTKSASKVPLIGEWLSEKITRSTIKHYYLKIEEGRTEKVYEIINKDTIQELRNDGKKIIEFAFRMSATLPTEFALSGTSTADARRQIRDLMRREAVIEAVPETAPTAEQQMDEAIATLTPDVIEDAPAEVADAARELSKIPELETSQSQRIFDIISTATRENILILEEIEAQEQADVREVEASVIEIEEEVAEAEQLVEEAQEESKAAETAGISLSEKARLEQIALIEEENLRRARARRMIARYVQELEEREAVVAEKDLVLGYKQEILDEMRKIMITEAQPAYDAEVKAEEIIKEHNPKMKRIVEALIDYKDGYYATDMFRMIAYMFNEESITGKSNEDARIGDVKPHLSELYNEILKTITKPEYDPDRDYLSEENGETILGNFRSGYSMDPVSRYMDMETEQILYSIIGEMLFMAPLARYDTETMQGLLAQISVETISKMGDVAETISSDVEGTQAALEKARIDVESARSIVSIEQDALDELLVLRRAAEEEYQRAVEDYSPIDEDAPMSTIVLAIPDLSPDAVQKIGKEFPSLHIFVKAIDGLKDDELDVLLKDYIRLETEDARLIVEYINKLKEKEFDTIYASVPLAELRGYEETAAEAKRSRSYYGLIRLGLLGLPLLLIDNSQLSSKAQAELMELTALGEEAEKIADPELSEKVMATIEDLPGLIQALTIEEMIQAIEQSAKAPLIKKKLKEALNKKKSRTAKQSVKDAEEIEQDIIGLPIDCGRAGGLCMFTCEDDYNVYWQACKASEVCCIKE